ncbi:hypothetical protein TanjilG_24719 [Lupinus angustifolius]|uniref:CobW C-terminal domain-containing protein n=1 Tax=Lupinus angustifolius TaxID=3871 RepID=A0A4P1RKZ6_LUPAN|nr:hypothetical protein TanjilG_24719 [Lupinus angustifolius]
MASLTPELVASTFFSFSHFTPKPFLHLSTRSSRFLTHSHSSSTLLSLNAPNPTRPYRARRFTVSATATASPQTDHASTVIPHDNRIPATIITGFLGSGKTTLLNHILTAEHGKKIAVIENEFGEVDIDGSLVATKAAGAEDIMMLNNGCLCCTVRGDLVRMISELVTKKKGKFDHIVIETTGLANPAPIIQTFYAENTIFNKVKLDGVVTLVDAKHATFHLDEVKPNGVVNEAVEQIAYADQHDHDHHAHVHTHDPGVSSVSIVCEGSIDLEKANVWLGTLLLDRSEDIYRMKGLLAIEGMNERFVFQGVHDIFQGSPERLWGPDEPRINNIVFIGKKLDAKELEKGFKACLL